MLYYAFDVAILFVVGLYFLIFADSFSKKMAFKGKVINKMVFRGMGALLIFIGITRFLVWISK